MKKYFFAKTVFLLFVCCLVITCASNNKQKAEIVDDPIKKALNEGGELFTGNSRGSMYGSPYSFELWSESGNNNSLLWYGTDVRGGAAFRAEWNNSQVFLGRLGFYWDEGKYYTHYGNVFCDFKFTRSANGTAGGTSYIGIYGWSKNPLIEWYIVEDWFDIGVIGPSRIGGGAKKVGEFTVDDGTYFIYEATRVEKPSIDGTKTFKQFFSVRQTTRRSGTISITEHFKEWEKVGLVLGSNMYEARFLIEAGSGTGWLETQYLAFRKN